MKKLLLLATILTLTISCGVKRPNPPQLNGTYGDAATYYGGPQSDYSATVYDFSSYRLDWDVSYVEGAAGVVIIAATDYNCKNVVSQRQTFIVSTLEESKKPNYVAEQYTLYNIFETDLNKFKAGTYYICLKAYKYNGKTSSASYPSIVYVRNDQYGYY